MNKHPKTNNFVPSYCTHRNLIPSPKGWWCECGAELDDRNNVIFAVDFLPELWED